MSLFKKRKYTDTDVVESQRNEIIPEEFPEGPYGSPMNFPLSQEWEPYEHAISAFTYEARQFHEGIPRREPGSHPTHDDPQDSREPL
ncbi:hypothetical protein BSNK01_07510 [Bacillaceae bacterium]